jgi:hypothetical protein
MLDVLEAFLNLHGYTYVRLDGSVKVEARQKMVDRFNLDPKIFCFISSTRCGGIGINLTGADCVIFYDTDWNPAMDKQAFTMTPSTPEQLGVYTREQRDAYVRILRSAGVQPE